MSNLELLERASAAFDWFLEREAVIEGEPEELTITWKAADGRRRAITITPSPGDNPLLRAVVQAHTQAQRMS